MEFYEWEYSAERGNTGKGSEIIYYISLLNIKFIIIIIYFLILT